MVRFSLNIKTTCLYVIWESTLKFGQKLFASPKICTPIHLWSVPSWIHNHGEWNVCFWKDHHYRSC